MMNNDDELQLAKEQPIFYNNDKTSQSKYLPDNTKINV